VISGADAGLDQAAQIARQSGARQVQRMMVSVPSHSPLLDAVSQRLSGAIQGMEIATPRIPYISNRRARVVRDAAGVREDLVLNVSNPVRWHDSVSWGCDYSSKCRRVACSPAWCNRIFRRCAPSLPMTRTPSPLPRVTRA
jgi:malonyl CoA-acyl carrier protein transacylase